MNKLNLVRDLPISIDVEGSLMMDIKKTSLEPYLEIHSDLEGVKISVSNNTVKIIDTLKDQRINREELFDRTRHIEKDSAPLEVISNFILDIVDIVHKGKNLKSNSLHIMATLYVNEGSEIEVDCSNLKVNLEEITLAKLSIDSSNMKFSGLNYQIQELDIDSSNLEARLKFDKENNNIKINASNAKLVINTTEGFDGYLDLDYSNLKSHSQAMLAKMLNKQSGVLSGDFSNLKIEIYS